ncbi:MAG: hypothetical protein H5U38_13610, partial [Calditrichaeota bacterium]|nr:hypothetical protein [Calditrichota bacterium]
MKAVHKLVVPLAVLLATGTLGVLPVSAQKIVPHVKTILHTLPLEKQEWMRDFHERVEN